MLTEINIWSFSTDSIALAILCLIAGFAILILGAEWLVKGSSSVAKSMGVSDLAIGLTVVAFGTSTPELIISLLSALDGKNDASFGNVIGSNNFNMLLILGISGVIFPLAVQRNTVKYEIPLSLFAAILLFVLVNDALLFGGNNQLSLADSLILLAGFLIFLSYVYQTMKANPGEAMPEEDIKPISVGKAVLFVVAGLAMLIAGGKTVVDSAVGIATEFGWSEKLIGLTILAAGTSLPELATSAVAAYRKNPDIAIGNVVGSNIFNILFTLSFTGLIHPLDYNTSMNFDLYVLFVGTILLMVFMFTLGKRQLDRWEAILFLLLYLAYTVYLIVSDPGSAPV